MKIFLASILFTLSVSAGVHEIKNNQLQIDGVAQPQLFGAEVQYFRLRGGYGPNVPRAEVIRLWAEALDRLKEAHMNAISFYIPWDFHEYAPGKFDFDGTVDEDGDGNPDYPSRDVKTFFKMIADRGIKHIMVRPGPYVNAEWGFLGFGAIPLWFHQTYPESHMKNATGQSTKLYDYHNPDLLRHTRLYFQKLYDEVLKDKIGPGKPISFLQLDNETNFMWQSLYNHDYGAPALLRYQKYLQQKYLTLEALNQQHGRQWTAWQEIQAPTSPRVNVNEDQDWYSFADDSVATYLEKIRRIWEDIGVREPEVLFTLADSYNATQNGLIPNYQLHNQKGKTGLLTVNLYPKTYETNDHPLMNLPFKTDHDVKAADSASTFYFGGDEHWAMGPEIQAGWWRGIPVSSESRQQTYLSVIGHGLKAMFVYYFNEGDNWQTDWARQQIQPIYSQLRAQDDFRDLNDLELPPIFWKKLQSTVDRQLLTGFDVKAIMHEDTKSSEQLYFDAPLSYGAIVSSHFFKLKEIGEKLIAAHGEWLGKAGEVTDAVCLLKDQQQNIPSFLSAIDSVEMNSTWESGLMGYLLQSGINPQVMHWGIQTEKQLEACQIIIRQDGGETSAELAAVLKRLIEKGHSVVNFLADSLSIKMGFVARGTASSAQGYFSSLTFRGFTFGARSSPMYKYSNLQDDQCRSFLNFDQEVVGYQCDRGLGHFTQIGALFYDAYNSNDYGRVSDLAARNLVLQSILNLSSIVGQVQVSLPMADASAGKVVAFARKVKDEDPLWITLKSSFADATTQNLSVQGLQSDRLYSVQDLLTQEIRHFKGDELARGIPAPLAPFGSTVYWLQ